MDIKHTCSNCGAELEPEARFCKHCGKAVHVTPRPEAPTPSRPAGSNKTCLIIAIVAVVLIGLVACFLAGGAGLYAMLRGETKSTSTPELVKSPVVYRDSTQTAQPPMAATAIMPAIKPTKQATAKPAAQLNPTASAESYFAGKEFYQDNIRFTYDPLLADDAFLEHVPAVGSFGDPVYAVAPAHRMVTLTGYANLDNDWQPQLRVYPVKNYYALAPEIAEPQGLLQVYTDVKDIDMLKLPLPFFPPQNAGQMIAAKPKFIDFINGSGLRYITQFSSDISPVDNTRLLYTFQGMADGGKLIVSVAMPISNAAIPAPSILLNDPDMGSKYQQHLDEMYQLLENTPDNDYYPTIQLLDQMVESLEVH